MSIHYTGTLLADGHKFDSTHDKGRPFSFKVGNNEVIVGWDAAIKNIPLGVSYYIKNCEKARK